MNKEAMKQRILHLRIFQFKCVPLWKIGLAKDRWRISTGALPEQLQGLCCVGVERFS